jgi:hypothetical protein
MLFSLTSVRPQKSQISAFIFSPYNINVLFGSNVFVEIASLRIPHATAQIFSFVPRHLDFPYVVS